mmetsp:Transcript_6264/g.15525  ORF Transcript_6264/g.15525 Transcript_6264/m.15525 type:complete len:242 (+) Transcript_6264:2413-3138(+)
MTRNASSVQLHVAVLSPSSVARCAREMVSISRKVSTLEMKRSARSPEVGMQNKDCMYCASTSCTYCTKLNSCSGLRSTFSSSDRCPSMGVSMDRRHRRKDTLSTGSSSTCTSFSASHSNRCHLRNFAVRFAPTTSTQSTYVNIKPVISAYSSRSITDISGYTAPSRTSFDAYLFRFHVVGSLSENRISSIARSNLTFDTENVSAMISPRIVTFSTHFTNITLKYRTSRYDFWKYSKISFIR